MIFKSIKSNLLLICLLGFVAHSFMLSAPFKILDDTYSIVENEQIKDVSYLDDIFTSSYFKRSGFYRPLVYVSYMVDYHLFGLNPLFYHLSNLLLHLATAILAFFLIKALTQSQTISFWSGLLFAIHPINSEAVWNIPDRAIILSTFFALASFLSFITAMKGRTKGSQVALLSVSIVCFVLSVFSKESGMMVPGVLISYIFICRKESRSWVMGITPFFIIIGMFMILRKTLMIDQVYFARTPIEWILGVLSFLRGGIDYFRLFIFPGDLYFDRSIAMLGGFLNMTVVSVMLFYGCLSAVVYRYRLKFKPIHWFLLLWVIIELASVSQIFVSIGVGPGYISVAEHFVYPASIAIFALIVMGVARLLILNQERNIVRASIVKCIVGGMIAFLFLTTIQQSTLARVPILTYERSLSINPNNNRINIAMAMELIQAQRFAEAEVYLRQSLKLDPFSVPNQIALGKVLCDQGYYWEGIEVYKTIGATEGNKVVLKNNLKLTYPLAIKQYKQLVHRYPDNTMYQNRLSLLLQRMAGAE
ncbi:MAG: hypothetical protein ACI9F2_000345 [Lysobacterales bacterium]|jgi:hypothetical protein